MYYYCIECSYGTTSLNLANKHEDEEGPGHTIVEKETNTNG